jgi:hypothetical protein
MNALFHFNVVIVQYDEVKEEITNDDYGITLIGRCAYDSSLDDEKIRRPALRIIDAMSFSLNKSALEHIKDYDALMDHIKFLSDKDDKYQAETANRILWKVEKESTFILEQKIQEKQKKVVIKKDFDEKKATYQYVRGDYRYGLQDHTIPDKFDIMISYCQSDKELCSKIYNRLKEANFYRVLFEKDNIHPESMAKAIEKSSIVIICLSNQYRNTNACRLEAEYAEKRERSIVPVKVDRGYKPVGWLNKLIEDKVCIDFAGYEFNTMYAELIEEINKIMAE